MAGRLIGLGATSARPVIGSIIQVNIHGAGGVGYKAGDILTLPAGTEGTLTVTSINSGGSVYSVDITTAGRGFTTAHAAVPRGGSGSGLKIDYVAEKYLGDFFYDTTLEELIISNGTAWKSCTVTLTEGAALVAVHDINKHSGIVGDLSNISLLNSALDSLTSADVTNLNSGKSLDSAVRSDMATISGNLGSADTTNLNSAKSLDSAVRSDMATVSSYASNVSGLAAAGSGLAAAGSGLAAAGSGLAANASGLAANASGLAANASGLASGGSGLAAAGSGLAASASGLASGVGSLLSKYSANLQSNDVSLYSQFSDLYSTLLSGLTSHTH